MPPLQLNPSDKEVIAKIRWQRAEEVDANDMQERDGIYLMNELQNVLDELRDENTLLGMSVMQEELSTFRRRAIRLLVKLSHHYDALPPGLFVRGIMCTEKLDPHSRGGFADIFQGILGEIMVAVKRLRAYVSQWNRAKIHEMLRREAILWRQLDHPHILPFLGIDSITFAPLYAIVSPWMQNGNLFEYLQRFRPSTLRVNELLLEAAHGLRYLHELDVVHGDLRAANVLITDSHQACLADFGFSRISDVTSIMANASTMSGNARWLAPEFFKEQQQNATKSSDIFAFGRVCLEAYTLKVPFWYIPLDVGVSVQLMNGNDVRRPMGDDSDHSHINDELWEVLQKCWNRKPINRPTAVVLAVMLRNMMPSDDTSWVVLDPEESEDGGRSPGPSSKRLPWRWHFFMHPSYLYAKELMKLGHGLPLWIPEPTKSEGPVQLADVGYVRNGRFARLFNALEEAPNPPDQTRLPDGYRPISLTKDSTGEGESGLTADIYEIASEVKVDKISKLSSQFTAVGCSVDTSQCRKQGAKLVFAPDADVSSISQIGKCRKYFRKNRKSWYQLANDTLKLGVSPDEILFVYGLKKTAKWATATFTTRDGKTGLSLNCPIPPVPDADISFSISSRQHSREQSDWGPKRYSGYNDDLVETAAKQDDLMDVSRDGKPGSHFPGTRDSRNSDVCRKMAMDQTIFINTVKMASRVRFLKFWKVATGPPDYSKFDDSGRSSGASAGQDSFIQMSFPHPCDPFIAYIFENSEAEFVLACDDDVKRVTLLLVERKKSFQGAEISSPDLSELLEEFCPKVLVDADGYGTVDLASAAVNTTLLVSEVIPLPASPPDAASPPEFASVAACPTLLASESAPLVRAPPSVASPPASDSAEGSMPRSNPGSRRVRGGGQIVGDFHNYIQQRYNITPTYQFSSAGPDQANMWSCIVFVLNRRIATGEASDKIGAKTAAVTTALRVMQADNGW